MERLFDGWIDILVGSSIDVLGIDVPVLLVLSLGLGAIGCAVHAILRPR